MTVMSDQAEKLLATIQELRQYLEQFPQAQATFEEIQNRWLPSQLLPPSDTVLFQAINVLVNAGELQRADIDGVATYCSKLPLDNLPQVAGY